MKFVSYNVVPLCLIALAAFLIFLNKDGWGWCIAAAFLLAVYPSSKEKDEECDGD